MCLREVNSVISTDFVESSLKSNDSKRTCVIFGTYLPLKALEMAHGG